MNQAICLNTTCKMAATCSHALIYNLKDDSQETLVVINPKSYKFSEDGKCQYYCEPQTIKVAHGFLKMSNMIPNHIYHEFTAAMSAIYNHTDFYCMRNGKRPIEPERQARILQVLTNLGFEIPENPWDSVTEEIKYF